MFRRHLLRATGLGLLILAAAPAAHADIYKYVDADGNVTFTDRYRPGAVRVMSDFAPARGHTATPKARASRQPSPANFPRVTSDTQRRRDDLRRQILLDERAQESGLLTIAQAELSSGTRKPGSDLARLQASVRQHEQNLRMLDKELERLR